VRIVKNTAEMNFYISIYLKNPNLLLSKQ